MTIRPARPEDLGSLAERLGQERYFADRLRRQSDRRGVLLTAWLDDVLIGDVYLWLEPAEEPEIRRYLPRTPLVTHLEVHRDHRRQGTGTKLIGRAERLLAERGHGVVALAVEVTNTAAAKLYDGLGYRGWGHSAVECYAPPDENGHREVEVCDVLVKELVR
ncbi:N-acetyltransferase family protein [Lentzea chajnantorensis]